MILSFCIYRHHSLHTSPGLITVMNVFLPTHKIMHILIELIIWKCLLIFSVYHNLPNFISLTKFKIQLTFSEVFCCFSFQSLKY